MTTAHANGPAEMLMRLEVMVLQGEPSLPVSAIRAQITNAIDIVVQLARVPLPYDEGRSMKIVTEIAEVIGIHPGTGGMVVEPIFSFRGFGTAGKPVHLFTGYLPSFIDEIDQVRPSLKSRHEDDRVVRIEELFAL